MDILILATIYLGTRQVNLREARDVKAPADLAGLKLRMPGGPDWLPSASPSAPRRRRWASPRSMSR